MAPVNVIVYSPETQEGKKELARRAAEVHADAVIRRLKSLSCPDCQKLELLEAVMDTVRKRQESQSK